MLTCVSVPVGIGVRAIISLSSDLLFLPARRPRVRAEAARGGALRRRIEIITMLDFVLAILSH